MIVKLASFLYLTISSMLAEWVYERGVMNGEIMASLG